MGDLAHIDELNRRFGIAGIADIVSGNGGLPKVRVATAAASAEIYLHGAQVTHWQPAGAAEAIFLSERSHWVEGRAIRGGIPVCFPWFRAKSDNPKAPAHGFVRTKAWQLDSISSAEDDGIVVTLSTESDDSTRQWWPHEFRLEHRVTVGVELTLELTAANVDAVALKFEEALHTYFSIGQIQSAPVRGLDGTRYLDNTDSNREKIQVGDLAIAAPTDNAYIDAHGAAEIADPVLRRILRTEKRNSATTVVWNPWQQGAAALADLGDDEWQQMLCVEASNILSNAVTLSPGEAHTLGATISIVPE
jgi:glucose-6-phosphate 1-epimerase